jgi:hypothetical protein
MIAAKIIERPYRCRTPRVVPVMDRMEERSCGWRKLVGPEDWLSCQGHLRYRQVRSLAEQSFPRQHAKIRASLLRSRKQPPEHVRTFDYQNACSWYCAADRAYETPRGIPHPSGLYAPDMQLTSGTPTVLRYRRAMWCVVCLTREIARREGSQLRAQPLGPSLSLAQRQCVLILEALRLSTG